MRKHLSVMIVVRTMFLAILVVMTTQANRQLAFATPGRGAYNASPTHVESPAAYGDCRNTAAAGNAQDRSFFADVAGDMGIAASPTALDAFVEWIPKESTTSCWNPFATTYQANWIPNGGCTDSLYNGAGVRNYSTKGCGEQATARTLMVTRVHSSDDYADIRAFLAGSSFNSDAIVRELGWWIGNPGYASDLRNQWQSLWNSRGSTAGDVYCANEGQRCNFAGVKDAAYGADGRFNFKVRVTGGIDCNDNVFGDAYPGVAKACYTKNSAVSPPAEPSNLRAAPTDSTHIRLDWSDNSNNESGFAIYDSGTFVTNVGTNTTSYTVGGVSPNSYHCYHLYAYNNCGNSAWTGWGCATTPGSTAISTNTWYSVVNKNSRKCVDARNSGTANGTIIQQYSCNNTCAQQFQFQLTSGGYYRLIYRNSGNQVWDVNGASTADRGKVQLWGWNGGNNQQWLPVSEGNGYYHFVARNSGKCLDVPGAATGDGLQLQQWTCNGTGAQSFSLASH